MSILATPYCTSCSPVVADFDKQPTPRKSLLARWFRRLAEHVE